jgi:hypothetical protein
VPFTFISITDPAGKTLIGWHKQRGDNITVNIKRGIGMENGFNYLRIEYSIVLLLER